MKAGKRKRDWPLLIDEQGRSGQTAAGYCRSHGINYELFLYHRKKALRLRRDEKPPVKASSRFIPISVPASSSVRLTLSKGVVLESDRLPDVAWLVEFMRRLPCMEPPSC